MRVERTPGTLEKRVRSRVAEVLGVARADLDEVAVVAGDVMHLEDFCELGEGLGNPVLGTGLVAANGDEGQQAESERLRIDLGRIALQRSAGFELANPLQYGRRGEPDGARNLDLGLARVGLQELENLKVCIVESSVVLHNSAIMAEY